MKYQINDIELNVCDQGHGEQVLFFLHYWGGSSRTWGEVIKRQTAIAVSKTPTQRC
jgi:hypothetical protein